MGKPKKGKKGAGKKGKKGKKGGKKAKKAENVTKMAMANSVMWETRIHIVEQSRNDYRDTTKKLMTENDSLQTQMHQTEKDTIDVITYLRKQDQQKDNVIEGLHQQIKDLKKENRKEKEQLVGEFNTQLQELEERLGQRTKEVELMQSELKLVKEFRKKRAQMQKELDEIKDAMFLTNKEHKNTLARMEHKFFEEKMRLQQEANQKIAELAEKAHTEAIANLDETTRSVYKENVRLTEALSLHIKEGEELQKLKSRLHSENEDLKGHKELNDMMIQDKVVESRRNKEKIQQLEDKVRVLEQSLSHVVTEFERDRKSLIEKFSVENESSIVEIGKQKRVIDLKTKEMNKVKKLAKNILDQRTDVERFFLESLEEVKREIALNQLQYKKDAQAAYHQRMLAAHAGKADFPKVRTFNKSDNSTNSVFRDLEAAERLVNVFGKVDIADLTWEQKEKVLRYMFAKMNGKEKTPKQKSLPAIHQGSQLSLTEQGEVPVDVNDNTFLTQANTDDHGRLSRHAVIPEIGAKIEITAGST